MFPKLSHYLRKIPLNHEMVVLAFLIVLGLLGAEYWQVLSLTTKMAELEARVAYTQTNLSSATSTLTDALNFTRANVQAQISTVQSQVGTVGGTVSDLEKLTKTDPQLLAKYSKVYFLNENYTPARLVEIPSQYAYSDQQLLQVIPEAYTHLISLLDDAKTAGVTLYIDSAYRSFNSQTVIKERYNVVYGAGTANSFSADQGYSEHQLGTTVDFITTGTGGQLAGFDATPAYTWLNNNAYRFGYVLSYPKNSGYYIYEPWQWRYVGVKLATDLHDKNMYFYQMDQRTIDTYLVSFSD